MSFRKGKKGLALLYAAALVFVLSACRVQPPASQEPGNGDIDTTPPAITTPGAVVTPGPGVNEASQNIEEYLPLKVGNSWNYVGDGNEFASYVQKVAYAKGNRYQIVINNGGTIMANVVEVREDSLVNTYRSGEEYEDKNLLGRPSNLDITLLKLPIAVGTRWVSEENSYEIMDTNATVEVPAGIFTECVTVRIVFKDQTSQSFLHYKTGVGLVQSTFETADGYTVVSRLKEYDLKN